MFSKRYLKTLTNLGLEGKHIDMPSMFIKLSIEYKKWFLHDYFPQVIKQIFVKSQTC